MYLAVYIEIIFLVQFTNRLWASIGVTCSYSTCLFFCALDCGNCISIWSSSQHKLYTHGSIVKTIL